MIKTCCTCKKEKDISLFAKNKCKKSGYHYKCKECQKIYKKEHYKKNKKYYMQKVLDRKTLIREKIKEYKKTLSCIKCGFSHPAALDFHHRDPNEKDFSIAQWHKTCSNFESVKIEIEKCDVLCANCHRILHYIEK